MACGYFLPQQSVGSDQCSVAELDGIIRLGWGTMHDNEVIAYGIEMVGVTPLGGHVPDGLCAKFLVEDAEPQLLAGGNFISTAGQPQIQVALFGANVDGLCQGGSLLASVLP